MGPCRVLKQTARALPQNRALQPRKISQVLTPTPLQPLNDCTTKRILVPAHTRANAKCLTGLGGRRGAAHARSAEEHGLQAGVDLEVYNAFVIADQSLHTYVLWQKENPQKAYMCMFVEVDDWSVRVRCYKFLVPWCVDEWDEWCDSTKEVCNLEGRLVRLNPEVYFDNDDDEISVPFFEAEDEAELSTLWKDC